MIIYINIHKKKIHSVKQKIHSAGIQIITK